MYDTISLVIESIDIILVSRILPINAASAISNTISCHVHPSKSPTLNSIKRILTSLRRAIKRVKIYRKPTLQKEPIFHQLVLQYSVIETTNC